MTDKAQLPDRSMEQSERGRLWESNGFWGMVGALIGALIGGIFSFLAAGMTASAEAERSRQDFFLNERVAVYASLLGDAQDFQLSATRYNNLVRLTEGNAAEASVALQDAMADYEDAVAASWQVEIIATPPLQEAKQAIAAELDTAKSLLAAKSAQAADYFRDLDRVMTAHTSKFADAAAHELGAKR